MQYFDLNCVLSEMGSKYFEISRAHGSPDSVETEGAILDLWSTWLITWGNVLFHSDNAKNLPFHDSANSLAFPKSNFEGVFLDMTQ